MSPRALSDCLRARLIEDGRTLGQLALRTGIPKQTLSDWLANRHAPSRDSMDRAFAFLVSVGWDPLDCASERSDGDDVAA